MIELRTLNLEIKKLEYQKKFDFDTSENFIETYKEVDTHLNHLFIIHPFSLEELENIIKLIKDKKGSFFIILLSSDAEYLPKYNENNIWNITEGITNKNNRREDFNNFYKEIKEIESASNILSIQKLIIKYLDPNANLDPQTERDIAYIKLWQSMSLDNQDWIKLNRFKKNKNRINKTEYWLKELS